MDTRLKIAIIGIPGSGKSTLAKELSETLNLPHYPEPMLPTEQYSSMPNWAVTREISRLLFLRHRNPIGVFECLPGYNKYIFLDEKEMIRVNQVCNLGEYSHIFALNPSIDIVRERLLKRNRTNLLSIEIENIHSRYERYQYLLSNILLGIDNLYILEDNNIELAMEYIQ